MNDDWSYTQSVWGLSQSGNYQMSNWPAMTLVAQVLWGTVFCKIFGLSFLTLRLCTLITGLIGLLVFYRMALRFSGHRFAAALAALLLFFNPLFFSLSFTFMTDVHFLTSVILALFFFIRYLDQQKNMLLVPAALFSIIATLIRQPGLLVPFAFTLVMLLCSRKPTVLLLTWLPLLFTIAALKLYLHWLHDIAHTGEKVAGGQDTWQGILSTGPYQLVSRPAETLLYLGLFLLPLLPLYSRHLLRRWHNAGIKALLLGLAVILFVLVGSRHFPENHILYNVGLGPKLLKDAYWGINLYPQMAPGLWNNGLTLLGALAASGLLLLLVSPDVLRFPRSFRPLLSRTDPARILLLLIGAGYLALLTISTSFFDRYTLPLLCLAALAMLSAQAEYTAVQKNMALVLLAIMALFNITATHDYLSWNRARWKAAAWLTEEWHTPPQQIDGGFEFNGWHQAGPLNPVDQDGKSWWFVTDDPYVISFGTLPGYQTTAVFSYPRWFPPGQGQIFVLKRQQP